MSAGELEGVLVAEDSRKDFTKNAVQLFKLYNIPKVGVISLAFPNPASPIHWLDEYKIFLPYLESDITDRCNLNCRGCCHFANFSYEEEFYPLENFQRDLRQIVQTCDITTFRLLGGEPLILKNFDKYLEISRQYLPNIYLGIVTNGLLIPSLPQKILDALRQNNFVVHISIYPPALKILDRIKARLEQNSIRYVLSAFKGNFWSQMTLNDNHDPSKTMRVCRCGLARSVRNGKIYKCPIDAACYKFTKKFEIEGYPSPTGIDIFSPNFSSLIKMLDNDVELCYWCAEKYRKIPWEPSKNPKLEDWLADPDELKNFQ